MKPLLSTSTERSIAGILRTTPQAIGLSAPLGSGKGHIARYIASQLLDASNIDEHPYVLIIDAGSSDVGIDQVRSIQRFLSLAVPGTQAVRRMLIIESIDGLRHEAQNALLKTLEEPPEDTVMIVTYQSEQSILATIRSRLSVIQVPAVSHKQALEYFGDIDQTQVTRAYYMSGGYAGLLTALLDGDRGDKYVLAIEEARKLLAMNRYQRLASVDKLAKNKELKPYELIEAMYRLLEAGYRQSVQTKPNDQLKPAAARLKLVEQALSDLHNNVQAKLALSRLFLQL